MAINYDAFGNVIPDTAPEPAPEPQPNVDPAVDAGLADAYANMNPVEETSPTEQVVIDANVDDGLADAYANMNQEEVTSPDEKTVLDVTNEPMLSADEKAALEKQQADNRAALKAEEAITPTNPTPPTKTDTKSVRDWRVRISLAPSADYLYKGSNAGILAPLKATNGVVFPYTPTIAMSYAAGYDPVELTHSNYKIHQYRSSSVGDITITAEFTAQDNNEANYLLATIHFFRSVTKMFYGQDKTPPNGVPPPLCYLSGYGAYQFDNHPLVVTNFSYTLPNDVDYIRAGENLGGQNLQTGMAINKPKDNLSKITDLVKSGWDRLMGSNVPKGGIPAKPEWVTKQASEATYVPTKMTITLICSPVVSRHDVSNRFSLDKYGSGSLLRGSRNNAGGIW